MAFSGEKSVTHKSVKVAPHNEWVIILKAPEVRDAITLGDKSVYSHPKEGTRKQNLEPRFSGCRSNISLDLLATEQQFIVRAAIQSNYCTI